MKTFYMTTVYSSNRHSRGDPDPDPNRGSLLAESGIGISDKGLAVT
jgi:hypothetical protein